MPDPPPARRHAEAQRVMDRCARLATHTEAPGRITRRYLTPPVAAVHEDLTRWMRDAGMRVRVDAAGNLVGRLGPDHPAVPVLLTGSHIDTVPNGGRYDGVLGVLVGIAAAEALSRVDLPFALDVVAFSEEEGVRYAKPYLGSAAVAGRFDPAWLDRTDEQGVTLRDAVTRFGLDPAAIPAAAYDPQHVLGFIETHVEQGPVLEQAGRPVGVVNAIAGQSRLLLRFVGEAGHAGTSPMVPRRDAMVSAAHLIAEVQEYGRSIAGLRATVGYVQAYPNVRNVIPGMVEVSLDVRHAMDDVRDAAVAALLDHATRIASEDGVAVEVMENQPQPATEMDSGLSGLLSQAMADAGHRPFDLLSGAGHDAVAVAAAFPVAMLFVRHPGGLSHHPNERVDLADVAVAVDVLTRAVRLFAGRVRGEDTLLPTLPVDLPMPGAVPGAGVGATPA
ncbi:MAG: allantoate amidohydrolase [Planctomycetota bacterium]